jgi:hypothetical protein
MTKKKKQPASLFDQFEEKIEETIVSEKKLDTAKAAAKNQTKKKKSREDLQKERIKRAKNKEGFATTSDLLNRFKVVEKNKHVSHEFQNYGCYLASVLDDKKHTGLYIKMAKNMSRGVLERALSFVIDSTADNKAKLFMWKIGELKKEKEGKTDENK